MSLFFSKPIIVKVETLPDDPQTPEEVSLGRDVWSSLYLNDSRAAIWIRPTSHGISTHEAQSLLCWATCDPKVSTLAIPPSWFFKHPDIFRLPQMHAGAPTGVCVGVTKADHQPLQEVVLSATTHEAFTLASSQGSALENWLFEQCTTIIRDGADISLPLSAFSASDSSLDEPSVHSYHVYLTLPGRQGIAKRGFTRVTVIAPRTEPVVESNSLSGVQDSWQENLEISESFLVSSTLSAPPTTFRGVDSPGVNFCVKPLPSPVDPQLDDISIYIRTSDLRLLGVLNGDWVLVQHASSGTSRMARVCVEDGIESAQHHAMLSPPMLFNLCPSFSDRTVVRVSPLGGDHLAVPVAKCISLSRVSSPLSNRRKYEPSCIVALRSYFTTSRRLVKQGDIIALSINVDSALDPYWVLPENHSSHGPRHIASALVYFVVRSVEYDPIGPGVEQLHGHDVPTPATLDVGCFVDVKGTRIVQVGAHPSRIPDMYHYLGIGQPIYFSPGETNQLSQLSNASSLGGAIRSIHSTILLKGARGTGKVTAAMQIAWKLGLHVVEVNCYELLSEGELGVENLQTWLDGAFDCSPSVIIIRHFHALGQLVQRMGEGGALWQYLHKIMDNVSNQVIVIATMSDMAMMPGSVTFVSEAGQKALDEHARLNLLLEQLHSDGLIHVLGQDVSIMSLALQMAALVASDIVHLVLQTRVLSVASTLCMVTEASLQAGQFETVLHRVRMSSAQSVGMPSIPSVQWEDVGGLADVKTEILDTVQLPLDHPELFQQGIKKRSGVLLYGPPGTGKTLLAKAVATSCSLNFLSIKGPELLNMYIGESEANVRRVFQKARDARPCIIFFDELDSVAPKRGHQGDSGGVMDRIVSQLLAELDGIGTGEADVFVIGATNRPDLLDSALLRPGRFDRMIYLGASNDHNAQLAILQALTRKFKLHPDVDLYAIACQCPMTYTGADFYALCADAMLHALSRKVQMLEVKRNYLNTLQQSQISSQFYISEMLSAGDMEFTIAMEDFMVALQELTPSITEEELGYYISIQSRLCSRD
ncbi:AAA-domain-containing protein [Pisolithus marmoratus]|nr:AAA-domain-containing protein [Pisolithus marmoratus]